MSISDYYGVEPSSLYGEPRGSGRTHRGVDFSHSSQPGTVPVPALLAGTVVDTLEPADWHGFGYQVTIDSGTERISYAHGDGPTPLTVGQWVEQGATVLTEGDTGATDGSCVHIERYTGGSFVDPLPLIRSIVAGGGTGPTAPAAPLFPLPGDWYYGPADGPEWSVSGFYGNGEGLRAWQERMSARGWEITADGLYGEQTARIARAFQEEKGLNVDGLIGPATWAAAWTAPVT